LISNFVSFILNKLYLSDANPNTNLGSVSGSLGTGIVIYLSISD